MKQLLVNGVEQNTTLSEENCLNQLLEHVRLTYVNDTHLITNIKIDGIDLNEQDEREYSEVPLSAFESVEVFTTHPREVAEETLQLLLQFTHHLENYSERAANAIAQRLTRTDVNAANPELMDFTALVDGVSTFIDSLLNVKRILRIGAHEAVGAGNPPGSAQTVRVSKLLGLLEADLLDILKELTEYFQKGELAHVVTLLREHLPKNLVEWREEGIPGMIRSRDS